MTRRAILMLARTLAPPTIAAAVIGVTWAGPSSAAPTPTTINVISSANPSVGGQPVTFTATVATVPTGGVPTGTVVFSFTSHIICSGGTNAVPLVSGSASCATAGIAANDSPLTVTANYAGDPGFGPSGPTTLNQVINPASVAMVVTAANNQPGGTGSGRPNRFTATLSPAAPSAAAPKGLVTWTITSAGGATSLLCSNGSPAKVNAHEISRCSVAAGQLTAAGSPWTISAAYSGDSNFGPVTASLPGGQVVHQTISKSFLTASPDPAARSAAITISASVVVPTFAGTPNGSMTFTFGGTGSGSFHCQGGSNTITLSSSDATCVLPAGSTSALSTYTVNVAYLGDVNHLASTSRTIQLKVH